MPAAAVIVSGVRQRHRRRDQRHRGEHTEYPGPYAGSSKQTAPSFLYPPWDGPAIYPYSLSLGPEPAQRCSKFE